MLKKRYSQKVTIGEMRRSNKEMSDALRRGASKEALRKVFNMYYKDQAKELYKRIKSSGN